MKKNIFFISIALMTFLFQSCNTNISNYGNELPIAKPSTQQDYQYLLKKYVTSKGVRYQDWFNNKDDLAKLKTVTQYYAQNAAPTEENAKLAWYLNAYNASTLQKILDDWPNEGPLDASLFFFHKKNTTLSNKSISLLHLENKIIRKQFNEPRIHFALNCASVSCPPLHDQPFTAGTLDKTLEKLTIAFLNNNSEALIQQDQEVHVSKIFDWYAEDFGGTKNVLNYINQYRKDKIPTGKEVKILPYDWKLNQAS